MQLGDEFEPKPEMTKTGNEAAIDEWILSRLANCVALCNSGFKEYDFPGITTAIYNFWLYELCDVYLEAIKPVNIRYDVIMTHNNDSDNVRRDRGRIK